MTKFTMERDCNVENTFTYPLGCDIEIIACTAQKEQMNRTDQYSLYGLCCVDQGNLVCYHTPAVTDAGGHVTDAGHVTVVTTAGDCLFVPWNYFLENKKFI